MSDDNDERVTAARLTKPLFVYLKGSSCKGLPLKELRNAGYVPIPVDDFDSYQLVDPLYQVGGGKDLLREVRLRNADERKQHNGLARRVR